MFIPRAVTFLVMLVCAFGAAVLYADFFFTFPQEWMKYLSSGAASLFATSALVMLVGTFGMKRVGERIEIDQTKLLGRMMEKVTEGHRHDEELHCCDIYIDTTKATIVGALCFVALCASVLMVYNDFLKFLFGVLVMVSVCAGIAGILYAVDLLDNWTWHRSQRLRAKLQVGTSYQKVDGVRRVFEKLGGVVKWILILCFVTLALGFLGSVGLGIYMMFTTLMTMGYTFLQAACYILAPFAVVCFPLLCIVGKKILLRTGLASELCPTIQR